ncbi:acyl transferase/acyl hydrolase/lysophospholipase [Podospora aff. communis PSN243]|uniref:Acyl transferase/acyl hydrolase/lysophospholipase n=1 Tax=Podospora aff. communis PSN243 TaxID=3040156 RepID=A0AAV9GE02_9PEZI|nr:acyl transferase/acyl hydrolase/lysophospholipase [Podospora aff. communis PSN243]
MLDAECRLDISRPPSNDNSTSSFRNHVAEQSQSSVVEPSVTAQAECSVCDDTLPEKLSFCGVCELAFCDKCWDTQATHGEKSKARVSTPHVKTPPDTAKKVGSVLNPTEDRKKREMLHREDENTAWFGIERQNDSNPLLLQDYGRLNDFLDNWDAERDPSTFSPRIPSLVSFVGQTGAGKSSLVKLLVDLASNDKQTIYSTPVIGSRTDHLPTSEDVHLYLDPRTESTNRPILLADCEGLDGGDREPVGARLKPRFRQEDEQRARNDDNFFKRKRVVYACPLQWSVEGGKARSRGFAVTQVYPRLLYAFSDVVVFVLMNHRVIEKVFEELISWATNAIETTSNQPILPHAIIVLNASKHDNHERFWDSRQNTKDILASVSKVLDRNERLSSWADSWRRRGKTIETLQDLVLCYYSSIEVIRVPTDQMPSLVHDKVNELYQSVSKACAASLDRRRTARVVLDIQELQSYVREAFSVFAQSLEGSFDFGKAAIRNALIPVGFGANISKLLLAIANRWKDNHRVSADQILTELSYMVASCIMIDIVRHKNKGTALEMFPKYISLLDGVLEPFFEEHWPCEQRHPRTRARCVNVRARHAKGHQTDNGKVFAAGEYVSGFTLDEYRKEFLDNVYCCLVKILDRLEESLQTTTTEDMSEMLVASFLHRDLVLTGFFRCVDPPEKRRHTGPLASQSACFCCLLGTGQHPLPCGHLLCTECVMTFGKFDPAAAAVGMNECPIGGGACCSPSQFPVLIRMKPRSSGVRALTLDGGGIRGIVELEVLKCIERALGGSLRIQSFFDLIVGTSAGGLVALGLGEMNWSVAECIDHFERLCKTMFTPRLGAKLAIVGPIVGGFHHSRYETKPMERALKEVFSESRLLFGGALGDGLESGSRSRTLKVAVVASSVACNRAFVLSNYNRPADIGFPVGVSYHFQRPESASQELKVWEAARATCAAPQYFKEFHHETSRRSYVDGAILYNNPVRIAELERRILWPEVHQPDVILSIGAGSTEPTDPATIKRDMKIRGQHGVFSNWRNLFQILRNNMELALDCDKIWDDFYLAAPLDFGTPSKRLFRINPTLGSELPALDAVGRMEELREKVDAYLGTARPMITAVAHQLVASTFYFELDSIEEDILNRDKVQGKLFCRFAAQSEELRRFGSYLTQRATPHSQPCLIVNCYPPIAPPLATIPISHMVEAMRVGTLSPQLVSFRKIRAVTTIQMELRFGENEPYLISGFPRLCTASPSDLNKNCRDRSLRSHDHRSPSSSGSRSSPSKSGIEWKPPPRLEGLPHINLDHYADPGRNLGGRRLSFSPHRNRRDM